MTSLMIDSHVNLHGEAYEEDLDDVVARAAAAGVTHMLTISDRLDSSDAIDAVIDRYPHFWRSVGVHPHHAKDYANLSADELARRAEPASVIGIGECGLDFHYEYSDGDLQVPVFRAHIHAAQATGLPLIIHSRDADELMTEILLEEYAKRPFVPLLHCYTGGPALAKAALGLGGFVAFSGILTFKKAEDVRAVAADIPLDRLIVETDCPYLAPMPFRGRRNEPAYLPHVIERLADVKGVSLEEMTLATTDNFFSLFPRAHRPT